MIPFSLIHPLPSPTSGRKRKRGKGQGCPSSILHLPLSILLLTLLIGCQPAPKPTPTPSPTPQARATATHAPREERWSTFANGDDVRALALEGDIVWAGTRAGGLVRWDIAEGTYEQVLYPQDGLACNDVRSVVVDGHGNKWLATCHGLSVLSADGVISITYTTANSDLPDDDVTALAVDGSGRIWVGTNGGGVAAFDGSHWQVHSQENGLAANEVATLAVDGLGRVWVGYGQAGHGVSVLENDEWTTITKDPEGLASDRVLAIADDGQGRMWFGTWGSGVSVLEDDRWTTYTRRDGLASNYIWAIGVGEGGRIWFAAGASGGTGRGVTLFDGETWQTYTTEDGLASDTVWAITSGDGEAWFGTAPTCSTFTGCRGGGVSRFDVDEGQWTTYTTARAGLASNQITAIAFDAEGRAWVGTAGSGVSAFDGQTWRTYTVDDGLGSNLIQDIAVDATGKVWVGTKEYVDGGSFVGGGVSVFDGSTWTTYTTENTSRQGAQVTTVLTDTLADSSWAPVGFADDEEANTALTSGYVMFGTDPTFYRYQGFDPAARALFISPPLQADAPAGTPVYSVEVGLASNDVSALAIDAEGRVWVGTGDLYDYSGRGLSVFDVAHGTWQTYTYPTLTSNQITDLAFDPAGGKVWAATAPYVVPPGERVGGGVSAFDGNAWVTYTTKNSGLVAWEDPPPLDTRGDVRSIAVDGAGTAWIGAWTYEDGPAPVEPFDAVVNRFDGGDWRAYTLPDEGYISAIAIEGGNRVWVGTILTGAKVLTGENFISYTSANSGLVSDRIRAIAIDGAGRKWFGTADAGISVLGP